MITLIKGIIRLPTINIFMLVAIKITISYKITLFIQNKICCYNFLVVAYELKTLNYGFIIKSYSLMRAPAAAADAHYTEYFNIQYAREHVKHDVHTSVNKQIICTTPRHAPRILALFIT